MSDIAYQNKDITAKAIAKTLKGKSLAAFGLPHLKVVDILPTILPLTVKGKQEKQKLIVDAVNMARKLEDRNQTLRALAGILTFTDKIIDKKFKERIKAEMRMTQIAQMFIEEGRQEGRLEAEEKIVKAMLLKNKTVEEIHQDTDIPTVFIEKVKSSLISQKSLLQ